MSFTFSETISRSSSAHSLSVIASAQLHAQWAWQGLLDGIRYPPLLSSVLEDNELRASVTLSALLNLITLVSLNAFPHVLGLAGGDAQRHGAAARIYHLLWTLPLIGTSLYLNTIFCARTAKRAFTLLHGARGYIDTTASSAGLLAQIRTGAPRWIMLGTSFAIDFALRYIPVVGPALAFIFLCWVDAYYFFEFVWTARGMPLAQRVQHLEERWAYFLAFGLPSAVLLTLTSSNALSNATLFALIFPMHIVLATHARPRPNDPHSLDSTSADALGTHSSLLPTRLPVFAPVLWLDALALSLLARAETRTSDPGLYTPPSSSDLRSGLTRVARSPISARDGSLMGRTGFATFGTLDADSVEAGTVNNDAPWGNMRKFD